MKIEQIAYEHRIQPSTVKTYIRRYEKTQTVLTEYELKKKLNKKLNKNNPTLERRKLLDDEEMKSYLQKTCIQQPTKTLFNFVDDLMCNFGIYISKNTIDRMFKKDNWKWKKITPSAFESNDAE